MASVRYADEPLRKRSVADHELDRDSSFGPGDCPSPKKIEFSLSAAVPAPLPSPNTPRRSADLSQRRKASFDRFARNPHRSPIMQSPPSPAFVDPLPSFIHVLDPACAPVGLHGLDSTGSPRAPPPDVHRAFTPTVPPSFAPFHQPRNSTSTSASDSTESSPTTTASLDSSSMTEPSPGPSPQSPQSLNIAKNAARFTYQDPSKSDAQSLPAVDAARPVTPAKRPRNLKNLAVNTSASYNLGRAIATAPPPTDPERTSAPASPAFVKPPTPPRRKMGNISLTIMTPANSSMGRSVVPPTPSMMRPTTLRHFQSSPSLPLFTAGSGPVGGMTLPNSKPATAPRGFAEIPLEDDEEQEPNFDVPQSQEEKPDSYPNGPIRIYESGVDLYYEPSREVAMRYDVVMNVASEVKNPFRGDHLSRTQRPVAHPTSIVGILQDPQKSAASPTTPKATPIATTAPCDIFQAHAPERPEYIHMPWEHNTDIVPDLYHLVKLIDDRVAAGKTVLVHCQCGVSRSASLIVAYGLYKNPQMRVQEAYDAVKKRSKWIGPNMNLIMQLQEFKNGLNLEFARRDGLIVPRKSSTVPSASTSDSFDRTPSSPPTPRTAPLPPDREATVDRLMSSQLGPFSAGPMEPAAGSSFWDTAFRRSLYSTQAATVYSGSSLMSDTPYVDTKGHLVPLVTVVQNSQTVQDAQNAPAAQNDLAARNSPAVQNNQSWSPPSLPQFAFERSSWRSPSLGSQEEPQSSSDVEASGTFSPDLVSPRSTEFHMTALQPPSQVDSHDTFNILSPPPPSNLWKPEVPVYAPAAPPAPTRAAPAPQAHVMESLNSIFSPTSTSFAASTSFSLAASAVHPPAPTPFGDQPLFQRSVRNDSLIQGPSIALATPPRGKARLRPKFSAPNLTQCIQLQKMQDQISNALPRALEAEEALMSPRAGEFVANPFHSPSQFFGDTLMANSDTASQFTADAPRRDASDTPTSGKSDPRSPAQFGISPITRSIWGMI